MANNALTIGVVGGLILAAVLLVLIAGSNSGDAALNGYEDDVISVTTEITDNGERDFLNVTVKTEGNGPLQWLLREWDDEANNGEGGWADDPYKASGAVFEFELEEKQYRLSVIFGDNNTHIYLIDGVKQTIKAGELNPDNARPY